MTAPDFFLHPYLRLADDRPDGRAWAAQNYGCDKIGPDCPGRCIAKCEDIANLRVTLASLRADLAESHKERDADAAEVVHWRQRALEQDLALLHAAQKYDTDLGQAQGQLETLRAALARKDEALRACVEALTQTVSRVESFKGFPNLVIHTILGNHDETTPCFVCAALARAQEAGR